MSDQGWFTRWSEGRVVVEALAGRRVHLAAVALFTFMPVLVDCLGIMVLWTFMHSLLPDQGGAPRGPGHGQDTATLFKLAAAMVGLNVMRAGFSFGNAVAIAKIQHHVTEVLRLRFVDFMLGLELSFFSRAKLGELHAALQGVTERVGTLCGVLAEFAGYVLAIVAYGGVLATLSWRLSVLSLLLLAGVSLLLTNQVRRSRALSVTETSARAEVSAVGLEILQGIRTILACAAEEIERDRIRASCRKLRLTMEGSAWLSAGNGPLTESAIAAALITILVLGVWIGTAVPTLMTFLFVLMRLGSNVRLLNSARMRVAQHYGALENLNSLLDPADKPVFVNGSRPYDGLQTGLVLRDVHFAYLDGKPALCGATLEVPKGKMTALVGATGAGKSTIADLLGRFIDPGTGVVLLDGIDLRQFDIRTLRKRMAIVSQDTYIFNASLRENLAFGLAGVSDNDLEAACRDALALDFVNNLPERFETILGERGTRLSGGQRQRIAIARALLRRPEILILDEATSALDSLTEEQVQLALGRLMAGRTVVAIAHRLSTIAAADNVVVIDGGVVIEQGTYRELLAANGLLAEYHRTQFKWVENKVE